MIRLGINIDHVATVRQARKELFPDPVDAAREAIAGGADGITAHLREDRRHIQDDDIERLNAISGIPLNMEMAAADAIISIAERVKPAWVCLVPERREELTTEGGLNVTGHAKILEDAVRRLKSQGIRISFFIDPVPAVVDASVALGADAVELHTGTYAHAWRRGASESQYEIDRLAVAAGIAEKRRILVNAGHGLDYENVGPLIERYRFHELNIGFAIVARALSVGMRQAVSEMKEKLN